MFITPAFAQSAPAAGGSDFLINMLPIVAIFAIMYFLIIRPQQLRMKSHREMLSTLRRNDTVVTSGGVIGKVTKIIDENEIQVEISEGVRVRMVRSMIAEVRTKGEPVKEDTK